MVHSYSISKVKGQGWLVIWLFLTLRCYSLFWDAGKSTKYGQKEYWPMDEINPLTAVVWPSEQHILPPTQVMTSICGMYISCIPQIRWSLTCTTPEWMPHSSINTLSFHLAVLINPKTVPLASLLPEPRRKYRSFQVWHDSETSHIIQWKGNVNRPKS